MSLTGQTKIIADLSGSVEVVRAAEGGRPSGSTRRQRVAAALAADAQAADLGARRSSAPARLRAADPTHLGVRVADPAHLSVRRAALAAALQEWSGTSGGPRLTTALAILAASRTEKVRQEATRAAQGMQAETVFEAFFRGVQGLPAPARSTGWGGQQ